MSEAVRHPEVQVTWGGEIPVNGPLEEALDQVADRFRDAVSQTFDFNGDEWDERADAFLFAFASLDRVRSTVHVDRPILTQTLENSKIYLPQETGAVA